MGLKELSPWGKIKAEGERTQRSHSSTLDLLLTFSLFDLGFSWPRGQTRMDRNAHCGHRVGGVWSWV